jgi:hypothetical protein
MVTGNGPPRSPECEQGAELAKGTFASGAGIRITEPDGGGYLCLVMEQWGSKQIPLAPTESPSAAQPMSSGSAGNGVGMYHLFAVPDDFPDVTVLDETAAPLTSAQP